MRRLALSLLVSTFAVTACKDVTVDYVGPDDEEVEGTIAGMDHQGGVSIFPTDIYSTGDLNTFIGRRVTFDSSARGGASWIAVKRSIADQVAGLDGFGTSAGSWVRFSEPIDYRDTENILASSMMGYLQGTELLFLPIEVVPTKYQVAIRPLLPLPPNTPSFHLVITNIKDSEGKHVKQSPDLTRILKGETPEGYSQDVALRTRSTAQTLVDQGIVSSTDEIAALAVFTTQSIHETDLEIAEFIRNRDPNVQVDGPCDDLGLYRFCSFSFEVPNFINDQGYIDDDAADKAGEPYRLTAHVYLPPLRADDDYEIPKNPEEGYALSIFGHGLTGGGADSRQIARFTADFGMASLAIDAPQHGEHPLRTAGDGELDIILDLFGIEIEGEVNLNARVLRDGWRHSNLDKIALVEALKTGIDFDEDGFPEIDRNRMTYLGGSLGAIQGSEFLALTDDFVAGMYGVGGGRISDIIRYGDLFSLVNALLFARQNQESLMQIFIMIQTTVEKGDGVNWAPYIMENRLVGTNIPHIAMQISVPDEIVPAESGMVIARAIGVDAVGEMPLPDPLVTSAGTSVKNNHPSGRTAGLIQTNWIRTSEGEPYRPSEHAKSADSLEGIAYWSHAFLTLFGAGDGEMELIDPYSLPSAPPRP